MAADFVGMAFFPYYSHIIRIMETDPELKKAFNGGHMLIVLVYGVNYCSQCAANWLTCSRHAQLAVYIHLFNSLLAFHQL